MQIVFVIFRVFSYIVIWISFLLSATYIIAYDFELINSDVFRTLRRIMLVNAASIVLLILTSYLTGSSFIKRGIIGMTSSQLIINIATMMHRGAVAFAAAGLIAAVSAIFLNLSKRSNITELKDMVRYCIIIAVVFWFIAWLIV